MEASNSADSKRSDGPRGCCGANTEKKSYRTPHTLAAPEAAGSAPYKRTFYKRTLPTPPCIDFASDEGAFGVLEVTIHCRAVVRCSLCPPRYLVYSPAC